MIFFSADTHFDHRNVIEYSGRPWPDVDAMNEGLVENWNRVVALTDEVWHLGDFALSKRAVVKFRPLLNGRIHLVRGNHDPKGIDGYFESIQEVKYLRVEGLRFYLSHYAHRVWRNSIHGCFHLYGHSHGDLPGVGRSMDVGVDAVGYAPIALEAVIERLGRFDVTDHHRNDHQMIERRRSWPEHERRRTVQLNPMAAAAIDYDPTVNRRNRRQEDMTNIQEDRR